MRKYNRIVIFSLPFSAWLDIDPIPLLYQWEELAVAQRLNIMPETALQPVAAC
jgi:hypothetical protein